MSFRDQKENLFVTSKWIYKIKHGAGGSIEKYKAWFMDRGFSHNREKTLMIYFLMFPTTIPLDHLFALLVVKDGLFSRWI